MRIYLRRRRVSTYLSGAFLLMVLTLGAAPARSLAEQPDPAASPTAAPPTAESALSAAELVSTALKNSPRWSVVEARIREAEAQLTAARAYPNPGLGLSVGREQARRLPRDPGTTWEVELSQPIEWPGLRRLRQQVGEVCVTAAQQELPLYRAELRAAVLSALLDWSLAREQHDLWAADLNLTAELQALVARRMSAGEASRSEALRAEAESLRSKRLLTEAAGKRDAAAILLRSLCGLDETHGDFPSLLASPEFPYTTAALPPLASHPALAQLSRQVQQAELQVRLARAQSWPQLEPGLSVGQESDTEHLALTLGMSIPLWDRKRGEIATAQAELGRLQAERALLLTELERSQALAQARLHSASSVYREIAAALLTNAEEALRLETLRYQQGESDLLALLDTRRLHREARLGALQARYEVHAATIELERITGVQP